MFNINVADDWVRTTDFWYLKLLLYQLSHNHCPYLIGVTSKIPSVSLQTYSRN